MHKLLKKSPDTMESNGYISLEECNSPISLDDSVLFESLDNQGEHADTPADGLLLSLNNKGKVDIEYIAKACSISTNEVLEKLSDNIYLNPSKFDGNILHGWETKDEYLSGNLKQKLDCALAANDGAKGLYTKNIKALKKAISEIPVVDIDDIYVSLGTPWIDKIIIQKFIEQCMQVNCVVNHDEKSGSWSILASRYGALNTVKYGTNKISAIDIILKTLNQTPVVIYKPKKTNDRKEKPIRDEKETLLALEKQKLIISEFEKWVKGTQERRDYIQTLYNGKYCRCVPRKYDGSYLTFPGMNPKIHLYDYQKNAVCRMILGGNVLLSHDMGSGKTYEMIAAGKEMKRMGLANKILYVVPNNVLGQWKSMFNELYPNSNILVVDPKIFTPSKRNETLNNIVYNDYDAIIMPFSSFNMIDLSPEVLRKPIEDEIEAIKKSYFTRGCCTSSIKRAYTKVTKGEYEDKIAKLGEREPGKIYFDDLGIDRLFVDEAHFYKNVPIVTSINALGLNTAGSMTSFMMMEKVHYIQRENNGGGVVFATGTPITNSITDLYNIQRYLQEAQLSTLGILSFNAWIANFAELTQNFEIDVDTSSYRMAFRYSKFHNLPELSSLLANIADFHKVQSDSGDLPVFKGHTDVLVEPSKRFKDFLKFISQRAEMIRSHTPMCFEDESNPDGDPIVDNMLLVTKDGRDGALDLRLVDNKLPESTDSKVKKCAEQVAKIYFETEEKKLSQLIFCDTSTPHNKHFNIYDEVKRSLIKLGIPEDQIAYIHDAKTETARKKLFKSVNDGELRILLGSSSKLGVGVNVQKRLIAIHHLDVTWTASAMSQRESRLIRPGNTNKEVFIYRYITKESFDAYSWQLLENKQNLISKLLTNHVSERSASDVDDTVLSYAEVKALAIGNPLIKERVEVNNKINKALLLQAKQSETMALHRAKIAEIESYLPRWEKDIETAKLDLAYVKKQNLASTLAEAEADLDSEQKQAEVESRNKLKQLIFSSVLTNGTSGEESYITDYLGFEIIAPAYTSTFADKFVYLKRNGRYHVNIGNSNVGVLVRINNYLKNFDKHVEEMVSDYNKNLALLKTSKEELKRAINYDEQIRVLRGQLLDIENKLGVDVEEA